MSLGRIARFVVKKFNESEVIGEMVKLGIFYEQDDKGKDTGRVQVASEEEDEVYDTFDTLKKAEEAMAKMQAEFDRNDKIEQEYSQWEKECMSRHNIGQEELRVLLANGVMLDDD